MTGDGMRAERVGEDKIRIPVLVHVRGGGRGHSFEEIGPDDPRYAEWDAWLTQREEADRRPKRT